jgi:hypothetical protein
MTTETETTKRLSEAHIKRLEGYRAAALSTWEYPNPVSLRSCVNDDMPILFTRLRAAYAEIDAKADLLDAQGEMLNTQARIINELLLESDAKDETIAKRTQVINGLLLRVDELKAKCIQLGGK